MNKQDSLFYCYFILNSLKKSYSILLIFNDKLFNNYVVINQTSSSIILLDSF